MNTASSLKTGSNRSQFGVETRIATDPWVHSGNLAGWTQLYEPTRPGPFTGLFQVASLGPIQIVHERVEVAFKYRGHAWPGSRVVFSYLPQGCGPYYDGRPVQTDSVITHHWDAVEAVHCNRRMELVLVAIEQAFLDRETAGMQGPPIFGREGNPVICARGSAPVVAFQSRILEMLEELIRSPALADDETARRRLQKNVIDAIVNVATASAERRVRLPPPCTRAYIVQRATEFIDSRLMDAISIPDVCAKVRVCPRTLEYSFIQVLGVSPTRYLLAARLNGARRELMSAGTHTSIETIASRWGFWHMSRFAHYYRQAFGELPSQTLRCSHKPPDKHPVVDESGAQPDQSQLQRHAAHLREHCQNDAEAEQRHHNLHHPTPAAPLQPEQNQHRQMNAGVRP